MSAAAVYFLFAMVAGGADAAALMTLGSYADAGACRAAAASVETALKAGSPQAQTFCISSRDVAAFSGAAEGAE